MKKSILTVLVCCYFIICFSFISFAGQWCQDNNGWWWCNNDRSYPVNCWQWIDDNNDGVAECYYFNQSGYCLMGTKTPDGYYVNPNGAWIVNGAIQKKSVVSHSSPNGLPYSNINAKEIERVNLASLQVISKGTMASVQESGETMLDGSYGKCISLKNTTLGSQGSTYIELYLGYKYTVLSLSYAPQKGMSENNIGKIQVYGDDNEYDLLFESDDINYKTHNTTVDIDVEGREFVKIVYGSNMTRNGHVLVKGFVE